MSGGNRAVFITGASTGIGEACVFRLARAGFTVYAGVRKQADGQALCGRASGRVVPILVDVADPTSIASAAERIGADVGDGRLAGLVNNAGIAVAGPLELIPLDDLRHQLEVNLVGQIAVTQAFLPLIRMARGRIVNMGSVGGLAVTPFIGAYCASKFGLEAVTDALRMELSPWGIEVVIIEPGGVATPIWSKGADMFEKMRVRIGPRAEELYGGPMGGLKKITTKLATQGIAPEEVAAAVEHALAAPKPKTRYVVGRDARLRKMLQRLPDRLRDRLILKRVNSASQER